MKRSREVNGKKSLNVKAALIKLGCCTQNLKLP